MNPLAASTSPANSAGPRLLSSGTALGLRWPFNGLPYPSIIESRFLQKGDPFRNMLGNTERAPRTMLKRFRLKTASYGLIQEKAETGANTRVGKRSSTSQTSVNSHFLVTQKVTLAATHIAARTDRKSTLKKSSESVQDCEPDGVWLFLATEYRPRIPF